MPSYPQIGGKLIFEQYYGDDVALFSKNERQRNPQEIELGLSHTPFPLLTWGVAHKQVKSGHSDTTLNLGLTYRLGESLAKQLSADAVAQNRTIAGSRFDLVDRNNNIVLEYQEQQSVKLSLDNQSGASGSAGVLTAVVSGKHAIDHVEWDASNLVAAGGSAVPLPAGGKVLNIVYPAWRSDNQNTYVVSAVAWDVLGDQSLRVRANISVTESPVQISAKIDVDNVPASGQDANMLTITVSDSGGLALASVPVSFASSSLLTLSETTPRPKGASRMGDVASADVSGVS